MLLPLPLLSIPSSQIFSFVHKRISFFGEDLYSTNYLKACLGVCCLMLWFSLSHYLEYFPRYYVMISMLKITAPRVSAFLLGVLPLFTGKPSFQPLAIC